MINAIRAYIEEHKLLCHNDLILLAVSGGIDSMVMLHLFQRLYYRFAVAHCNFHLRGNESDGDEQFVREYCQKNTIEIHVTNFDTKTYASEHGVSIEVAARELRYAYFDKLCKQHGYNKIAVAHNLNDSAETLLLNLTRGTGIRGLCGIQPVNGKIIRPLLFASRSQIETYAAKQNLNFRVDSTNSDTTYRRNYIRHKVLPIIREINPSIDRTIAQTAQRLSQATILIEQGLNALSQQVTTYRNNELIFSVDTLQQSGCATLFLVETLAQYGFSAQQALQVADLLKATSGKRIESQNHVVIRNRDELVMVPKKILHETTNSENADTQNDSEIKIDAGTISIQQPIGLTFEYQPISKVSLKPNPNIAYIDADKLTYPLTLRPWRPGDRFVPFGMKNHKKISDFLINNKIPLHYKSSIYVLTSGKQIVWLVGHRLDNRFKIEKTTCNVLIINKID